MRGRAPVVVLCVTELHVFSLCVSCLSYPLVYFSLAMLRVLLRAQLSTCHGCPLVFAVRCPLLYALFKVHCTAQKYVVL